MRTVEPTQLKLLTHSSTEITPITQLLITAYEYFRCFPTVRLSVRLKRWPAGKNESVTMERPFRPIY